MMFSIVEYPRSGIKTDINSVSSLQRQTDAVRRAVKATVLMGMSGEHVLAVLKQTRCHGLGSSHLGKDSEHISALQRSRENSCTGGNREGVTSETSFSTWTVYPCLYFGVNTRVGVIRLSDI